MRIRLTTQASVDLRHIWGYIYASGSGHETADRVLRRLDKQIRKLADFPNRGLARSDLGNDARSIVIQRWVVLYRVLEDEVLISRIVDGARDLSRISLSDDDDL